MEEFQHDGFVSFCSLTLWVLWLAVGRKEEGEVFFLPSGTVRNCGVSFHCTVNPASSQLVRKEDNLGPTPSAP